MKRVFIAFVLGLAVCAEGATPRLGSFARFQELAGKGNAELRLQSYPTMAEQATRQAEETINEAAERIEKVVALAPETLTFSNTFAAVDATARAVIEQSSMMDTVAQSSTSKAVREAASAAQVKLQQWMVGLGYREDLYRVLKAVADANPALDPEAKRQVSLTMRDYKRAGMQLPAARRAEVEKLQKELAALNTEYGVNINQARGPLDFTAEELDGVPESFLETPGVKQPDGHYRVMVNITPHYQAIGENAKRAETRKKVIETRCRLAEDKNIPLLKKLVASRGEIAGRLGYASWADYQTEPRMVKNGAAAVKFEKDLVVALEPKFRSEMEVLRKLKVKETGDEQAEIKAWDVEYYKNKLLKDRYSVDTEALRVFFPYQQTVEGMMAIYQRIFGLKFTEVDPPFVWAPGVQLYVVQDSKTGNVMGAFFLDMFPREGKFNHFACYVEILGGPLQDGRYELPVDVLLCNFPIPSGEKPSLLKHRDVETLFHEFGHVMHGMLSRSRFVAQTGFNVPQDFVEAPSQMLENWVWQKEVLDTFAADYRDRTRKIPSEVIRSMVEARQATEGIYTRRQLSFGLIDLAYHTASPTEAKDMDVVKICNEISKEVFVAPPAHTAFVAYIGHLAGYDAGYYGYLWAKSIAIDMASVFKKSPNGFLDENTGRRLREEVYSAGYTREVDQSVEKFLGRAISAKPFLEYLGAKPVRATTASPKSPLQP